MRFCNELKYFKANYNTKFLLQEYCTSGGLCAIDQANNDANNNFIIGSIIQIMFQVQTLFLKYGVYHGDLHINNILVTDNEDYENGVNKYYKYTYSNIDDGSDKFIYIPVNKKTVKIIDYDKSIIIKDAVKKLKSLFDRVF